MGKLTHVNNCYRSSDLILAPPAPTATKQYYYRARYYDAKVERFISEDPMGFGAGDTNLYRYVFNSPTNYTDPSGKIVPLLAALKNTMHILNKARINMSLSEKMIDVFGIENLIYMHSEIIDKISLDDISRYTLKFVGIPKKFNLATFFF